MTDQSEGAETADRQFTDPEFATLALTADPEETLETIHDVVKGLHATETPVGTKVRTTGGALVAVVHTPAEAPEDVASVLQYRTEPPAALATRKATTLHRALEPTASDTDADAVTSE